MVLKALHENIEQSWGMLPLFLNTSIQTQGEPTKVLQELLLTMTGMERGDIN